MQSLLLLVLALAVLLASSSAAKYTYDSQLPPRLQWLANDGYCGEVSTVAAGLKYGQYYSQYDIRDVATGSQQKYYLVGTNDQATAGKLSLGSVEFDSRSNIGAENYLAWVKQMTRRGYAVTVTVYMNYYLFYGVTTPSAGEFDYDHIVSVYKVESNYDDDIYHPDDVLVISDHGLWAPRSTGPIYLFNNTFQDFIGTREDANKKNGNVYTIPYSSRATTWNFGIAHTGIADNNKETNRVVVSTSVNYEDPVMKNRSEERPAAMPLTLTVTVSGLERGVKYNLYRYNDEKKVPASDFNSHSAAAVEVKSFTCCDQSELGSFQGDSFVMTENIMSSEKVIYRAVKA